MRGIFAGEGLVPAQETQGAQAAVAVCLTGVEGGSPAEYRHGGIGQLCNDVGGGGAVFCFGCGVHGGGLRFRGVKGGGAGKDAVAGGRCRGGLVAQGKLRLRGGGFLCRLAGGGAEVGAEEVQRVQPGGSAGGIQHGGKVWREL